MKAVERCFKRDGTELDAELEYRIPVDDMVELTDIEQDEVPENPYREKSDVAQVRNVEKFIEKPAADIVDIDEVAETIEVVTESFFTNEMDVTGNVEAAVSDDKVKLRIVVSDLETDAEDKQLPEKAVVEDFGVVASEFSEADLECNYTSEEAERLCLPQNKADYMRMTVAEKAACYPFDKMGTAAAFDMVKDYFARIGMDTDFNSVYEEMKLLTDYYETQKAEELINEKAKQVIENIELLGIEADSLERYAPDVLAEAFGLDNLDYSAGVKLFRRVLDRLDVKMSQWEQYEMFDRIYQEGMRERKIVSKERIRDSR